MAQTQINIENTSAWHTLRRMLDGQGVCLSTAWALTVCAVVAELVSYWLIFQAIDALLFVTNGLSEILYRLAGWMTLALLLKNLFYALAYFLTHKAAYNILAQTRSTLVTKLAQASLPWLQQHTSGALKQSVLQDVERIETFISHHTVEVFAALLSPLLVTLWLFWVDWRLALATLACAPLALLASATFMRGSEQQYLAYNQASAELSSTLVEYLRNMPVMNLFRQDSTTFRLMRERLQAYYTLVAQLTRKTVPGWSLFNTLLGGSVLFILPLGIWLYGHGMVTLTQVIMALVLGSGMLKPLLRVSHFFMEINDVLAGVRRMQPILALHTEPAKPTTTIATPLTIRFDQVSYAYNPTVPVVQAIDLCLSPGSFNVILGPSGSGKSTLTHLLGGLLLADNGKLTINDMTISELAPPQSAALIVLVTQETFLFKGSILENLRLAKPQASREAVKQALKVAQAETLIARLPQGCETQLGEQGVRLSGGEKQRITIARALLADTPVLVLDEATSSLDSLTQKAFFAALRNHYPHKTIVAVTHRIDGIEHADQLVVMANGSIEAVGCHAELLTSNSFYRLLWQSGEENNQWAVGGATLQAATVPKQEAVDARTPNT